MGLIRKQDDPIIDTQTDPVAYNQKLEEIKDGEKGAPKPSFRHYAKPKFFVDPPVENLETEKLESHLPSLGDPLPEDTGEEAGLEEWWNEDPEETRFQDEAASEFITEGTEIGVKETAEGDVSQS